MSRSFPLEPDGETLREWLLQAADRLGPFLDGLPHAPASRLEVSEEQLAEARRPPPEQGRPLAEILDQLCQRTLPFALNTTGPGYLAYVPGGGLPQAALADLLALITNRFVGLAQVAPVAATLETAVIRWLASLVGYSTAAGGFLTTGGSLANWAALVVARDRLAAGSFHRGIIYASDQAHHSVWKAAHLAGFPAAQQRLLPSDEHCRLPLEVLQQSVAADRAAGWRPLAVVAQAGTTNTGAIDDLSAIGQLARAEGLHFHVDAAYGGFFLLTERGRRALTGLELADSVTLDPHKGLFLPYGTGCLMCREREWLRQVFAVRGEYLPPASPHEDTFDFCDLSPELSREFRGLRVWLPLQMHGVAAFRDCLDEKLDLARLAADRLRAMPDVELAAPSPLSLVAFRLRRPGWSDAEVNHRNQEFLQQVNSHGRFLLSGTTVRGQFLLRLCILSFRTHRQQIAECLDWIERTART